MANKKEGVSNEDYALLSRDSYFGENRQVT